MASDAVSQSFVETAADIEAVRAAAKALGKQPFIIAKSSAPTPSSTLTNPAGRGWDHGGAR